MTSPQPVAPRRVRQYRGLLGRCAFLVPAVIFGAWRLAGAQEGPHGGDMAPFLVAFAAILVAAKVGGELVERLGQPAVLGELLVGAPVLSDNTFSAIVAMVMLTTLVTPPLLKAAFAVPSAANGNP